MPKILFIDDEGFFARPYIERLEKLFTVDFSDSASEGLENIRSRDEHKAIVLDIMMPSPTGIASTVTKDGLATGLWMLGEIKEIVIKRPLPVIILTNRALNIVEDAVSALEFPDVLVQILPKSQTPNFVLPKKVQLMVDKWYPTGNT